MLTSRVNVAVQGKVVPTKSKLSKVKIIKLEFVNAFEGTFNGQGFMVKGQQRSKDTCLHNSHQLRVRALFLLGN